MKKLLLFTMFVSAALFGGEKSYKIKTLNLPAHVAPEVGGLGFTPEGNLVVVLRRHGIFIQKKAKNKDGYTWQAFTEDSMHNACGVHVVSKSEIIVSQMGELTRVKDTDGDGKADLFENISDKWGVSGNYHETNTVVSDGKGGWYIALGTASNAGPTFWNTRGEYSKVGRRGRNYAAVKWKGWVMHIDSKGKTTPVASGFRMHNGIGRSPEGDIFCTDNQGDWISASPLYHVQKGKFYGHPTSLVWDKNFKSDKENDPRLHPLKKLNAMRTRPAVDIPRFMCNSASEPHFNTSDNFGPFRGQVFIGDIAGPRIIRCMLEKVDGVVQGACALFITGLRPGNNRLTFSPDGKTLYTGQTVRGWGRPSEGLQSITFNGKVPFEVQKMSLTKDGFAVTFTKAVDKKAAEDVNSYQFSDYTYKYSGKYGSKEMDKKKSKVISAKLSDDGKTVYLKLPYLKADRIFRMDISKNLKSKDNESVLHPNVCYTINKLRK